MNPRERLLTALNRQEPDRVPIVIGASNATTMTMAAYRRLKTHLDFQSPDRYLYDWPELGAALPDEALLKRLHSDVRGVHDRQPQAVLRRNRDRASGSPYLDDWGIGQVEIEPGVWYPHIHPLAEHEAVDELERHPWPDMDDPSRVAHIRRAARQLADENQFAILGTHSSPHAAAR